MRRILILGVNSIGHVGYFLHRACQDLALESTIIDTTKAMGKHRWLQRAAWRLAHYPLRITEFSRLVQDIAEEVKPNAIITTGITPISSSCLNSLRKKGIYLCNYSTDDPWNNAHKSHTFLKTIPLYHEIFSTRRAALADFRKYGAKSAQWLPFAYSPKDHYPDYSESNNLAGRSIVLIGGGDIDRVNIVSSLIDADLPVRLWGGYWDRHPTTKLLSQGMATFEQMRRLLSTTNCALTLVRRANRDGHAMRSFEVAAMAAPALAEDTQEHRDLYGSEGEHVLYFKSVSALTTKAKWMLDNPRECRAMGSRLNMKFQSSHHTYADRVLTMLKLG